MRTEAAVLREMGRAVPYETSRPLELEEVEVAAPGRGEALVEIACAGLCHSDLSVIDGSRPRVLPMVLGHEASGVVREIGPGVFGLFPGDHVVFSFVPSCGRCVPCATGRAALCEEGMRANAAGTLLSGERRFRSSEGPELHHHLGVSAFSRYTVAAEQSLVRVPKALPLERAALFGCAVMTGVGAVLNTAKVEAGASVAVFGLGGVGLSAVLGARAAGAATIVAVDLVDAKLELARSLGATHAVRADSAKALEELREASRGGVAYAFEAVGSEAALAQAFAATRRGGTTVSMGLARAGRELRLPAVTLVAEERVLRGSYMGSCVPKRDIPRFIAMHEAGLLPVERLLSGELDLAQINAGFDQLARGEAVRQVVRFGRDAIASRHAGKEGLPAGRN